MLHSKCVLSWGPSLFFFGQTSGLQIQRSGFDSKHYHIFWEVLNLERGPLSLVSATEELLERKGSSSGLDSREYGRRDPSLWPCGTLYPQKLTLTSRHSRDRYSSFADLGHGVQFLNTDPGRGGGAYSSIIDWGTMLQAGRSWVMGSIPDEVIENVSIYLIFSASSWPWGWLSP
jgi:hypothetical protein